MLVLESQDGFMLHFWVRFLCKSEITSKQIEIGDKPQHSAPGKFPKWDDWVNNACKGLHPFWVHRRGRCIFWGSFLFICFVCSAGVKAARACSALPLSYTPSPKDYIFFFSFLLWVVLGFELRASHFLGMHSTSPKGSHHHDHFFGSQRVFLWKWAI
jgi:hypothetical protein